MHEIKLVLHNQELIMPKVLIYISYLDVIRLPSNWIKCFYHLGKYSTFLTP